MDAARWIELGAAAWLPLGVVDRFGGVLAMKWSPRCRPVEKGLRALALDAMKSQNILGVVEM
jgi:hypothetical protein